jgi:butyryl-CoA dehydrogenase
MSFGMTEEQSMIQSMVRQFARNVLSPTAAERDRTRRFPRKNLKQMGELGLMGMTIPAEYGGAGTDTVSYALALAEIAYGCASTAVIMSVNNSIVCETLYRFGSPAQKKTYLKPLASGKKLGAFALTEPHAGSDPVMLSTTAERDGDHYVLNGVKRFVTSGKNAHFVLVAAKTDRRKRHKGISIFLVKKGTAGLVVGPVEDKMGLRASDTTDLVFDNCRVPAKNRLGRAGEGFEIAMQGLDSGRIGIAAQSLGVAQAAFDAAVEYARTRKQFSKPISKFQGIRWMLADMATEFTAARQLMLLAAQKKDSGAPYTAEASMAKLFASEMVNRATERAVQIHGGYGFIKGTPVERYYRDARVFTIYEGTSEIQRVVISNHILKDTRIL